MSDLGFGGELVEVLADPGGLSDDGTIIKAERRKLPSRGHLPD
jgi:hypothetical protein